MDKATAALYTARLRGASTRIRRAIAHAAEYNELGAIDDDWLTDLIVKAEAVADYLES